jgi:hypothetical protein
MEEAARKGVGPRSQASNKAPNSHAAAVITLHRGGANNHVSPELAAASAEEEEAGHRQA